MPFPLYFDDDAEARALVRALLARGYDALRATDAGMRGAPDESHLAFAADSGRALVSANRGDFIRLDAEWRRRGRVHAGVVLLVQQRYSVGEQLRRLEAVLAARTAVEMRGRVEFLSDWG